MAEEPTLSMILERVRPGATSDCFKLWACRGEGKGCGRNTFRSKKVHCDDCVETDPRETLEQLVWRIQKGDA